MDDGERAWKNYGSSWSSVERCRTPSRIESPFFWKITLRKNQKSNIGCLEYVYHLREALESVRDPPAVATFFFICLYKMTSFTNPAGQCLHAVHSIPQFMFTGIIFDCVNITYRALLRIIFESWCRISSASHLNGIPKDSKDV